MLRMILKRRIKHEHSGLETEDFFTIDAEIPEVEVALTRGGWGESSYDITYFVGIEVLPSNAK